MSNLITNQEVFRQMVERDVANLYESLRDQAINLISGNQAIKTFVTNYIKGNEPKILASLQEKCDLIVATSFPTPETTLEDAIKNANDIINASIGGWLEEKLNVPLSTVNIALQTLFGVNIDI